MQGDELQLARPGEGRKERQLGLQIIQEKAQGKCLEPRTPLRVPPASAWG